MSASERPTTPDEPALASRAGLKLRHALQAFSLPVTGLTCADFGCNAGGFTDVLLRAGAAKVFAVDTGYGTLAWRPRSDPRVVTMERTNALHADRPEGGVDLVVFDLAWTPQRLAVPAALRWLRPGGRIVSLVKPHYELRDDQKSWLERGFLPHARVPEVVDRAQQHEPFHVAGRACTLGRLASGDRARGVREHLRAERSHLGAHAIDDLGHACVRKEPALEP